MGQSKALLTIRGRYLLHSILNTTAARCDHCVVAAAPQQPLPPLPPGVSRVDDPHALLRSGPVVGLLQGLRQLQTLDVARAFLTSCDSARLDTDHIDFMFAQLDGPPREGALPVDSDSGRGHPLNSAVLVDPAVRILDRMIRHGERRAQTLFTRLRGVSRVSVDTLPNPQVVEDINSPAAWARWLAETAERKSR